MGRAPCCDKTQVKRGPWSPEEDTILKNHIQKHGTGGNWIALPHKAGLKRCGKSCRLRWLNYLRPDIKLGGFTEEEDNIILTLYVNIGSRWSVIASHLRGRTDNDVKNHWNTKLKKKLSSLAPPTTTTTTTINPIHVPKEEVNNYDQIMDYSIMDQSSSILFPYDSMITDYQQTLVPKTALSYDIHVSNSLHTVSSSPGLSPNAFSMRNEYASWSGNGSGVTGSGGDLLLDEFDLHQMFGEVSHVGNSYYAPQGLYDGGAIN